MYLTSAASPPHLQQECNQAANAHLGSAIVTPQGGRKV